MPIRPENRGRYPKDWKAISERIRFVRAKGQCECTGECGDDHKGRCDAWHAVRHLYRSRGKHVLRFVPLGMLRSWCEG